MSTDDLDAKSDSELNEIFDQTFYDGPARELHDYCADANAVLPWLEKSYNAVMVWADGRWVCDINHEEGSGETYNIVTTASGEAPTPAAPPCWPCFAQKGADEQTVIRGARHRSTVRPVLSSKALRRPKSPSQRDDSAGHGSFAGRAGGEG